MRTAMYCPARPMALGFLFALVLAFGIALPLVAPAPGHASSRALVAYAESVTVNGSFTSSNMGYTTSGTVSWTGGSFQPSANQEHAGSIGGRASGSVTLTISGPDVNCSVTSPINTDFNVGWGGQVVWVGSFALSQLDPAPTDPCAMGPADGLAMVHTGVNGCDGLVPAGTRALDEADNPILTISQTTSSSCGSITETAVIHNVPTDLDAVFITGGAALRGITPAVRPRWRNGRGSRVPVSVAVGGAGRAQITIRSGRHVLGVAVVRATAAGRVTASVPLRARTVNALLRTRRSVPITYYVAGGGRGIVRTSVLLR